MLELLQRSDHHRMNKMIGEITVLVIKTLKV